MEKETEKATEITEKKENFFKKAFRDMAESANEQHEVDKANFAAAHAEAKANFEENRGSVTFERAKKQASESRENAKKSPTEKRSDMKEERLKKLDEVNERKAAAEKRTEAAIAERERISAERAEKRSKE